MCVLHLVKDTSFKTSSVLLPWSWGVANLPSPVWPSQGWSDLELWQVTLFNPQLLLGFLSSLLYSWWLFSFGFLLNPLDRVLRDCWGLGVSLQGQNCACLIFWDGHFLTREDMTHILNEGWAWQGSLLSLHLSLNMDFLETSQSCLATLPIKMSHTFYYIKIHKIKICSRNGQASLIRVITLKSLYLH